MSCELTALPEGVTVGGLKEQVTPEGKPEQAELTVELKPFSGVTVTVAVPLPPAYTVSAFGDRFNVKVGEVRLMMYVADERALTVDPPEEDMSTASMVSDELTEIGPV